MNVTENRYIFLDIDGVLNTESDWKRPFQLNRKCLTAFLAYLKELQKFSSPRIILTSTWKNGYCPPRNTPQIDQLIEELQKVDVRIVGKTEQFSSRGEEINDFIKKHSLFPMACLVLDDDMRDIKGILTGDVVFFEIDAKTGFSDKDKEALLRKWGKG